MGLGVCGFRPRGDCTSSDAKAKQMPEAKKFIQGQAEKSEASVLDQKALPLARFRAVGLTKGSGFGSNLGAPGAAGKLFDRVEAFSVNRVIRSYTKMTCRTALLCTVSDWVFLSVAGELDCCVG